MSRNASGTYSLPAGNPVSAGTTIESTWANSTMSDIATALTNSLSRNGNGGMLAGLKGYDGTASLPGYTFTDETSSGLYRAGANDVRMVIAASEVARFGTGGLTGVVEDSAANTVTNVLTARHGTDGTPAAGFGVSMSFVAETSAGNYETGMVIEAVTTDVSAGSEDFDFVLKLMAAGATAAEVLRVTSAGVLTFSGSSLVVGTMTLAGGSITDSSGAISFGNENLSTTGTLTVKTSALVVDSSSRVLMGQSAAKVGATVELTANGGAAGINLFGRASDGIGTLNFFNNAGSTSQGYIQGRSGQFRVWADTGAYLSLGANGVEAFTVNTNGIFTATGGDGTHIIDALNAAVTNLATSVSEAALEINGDTGAGSDALWLGKIQSAGAQYIQAANGAGTTSYALNLNPFGGTVVTGADMQVGNDLDVLGNIFVSGSLLSDNDTGNLVISGGGSSSGGANIILNSAGVANPYDVTVRSDSSIKLHFDYSANLWDFQANDIVTTGIAYSAYVRAGDGSASVPALGFSSDSDTGFYRSTANQIGITIAGTQRGVLNSNGIIVLPGYDFILDNNTSTGSVQATRSKFWVTFNGTGTLSVNDSYNVTSVTDNSTGNYTVNIATDFANANWSANVSNNQARCWINAKGVGTLQIYNADLSVFVDAAIVCASGFGDQ